MRIKALVLLFILGISSVNCSADINVKKETGTNTVISEKNNNTPVSLDSSFKLKINETAEIKSESLKIKFLKVSEDSRCPSDVQCIWAGQVKIKISVSKDGQNASELDLTLKSNLPEELKSGNYSIKFEKIEPESIKSTEKNSDYTVTLRVSKN